MGGRSSIARQLILTCFLVVDGGLIPINLISYGKAVLSCR
jgi:hypothetical protein